MDSGSAILIGLVAGIAGGVIGAAAVGMVQGWMASARPGRRWYYRGATATAAAGDPGWSVRAQPAFAGRVTRPSGPFDRFDDRAKRVFALAQDEAIRLNHNYIGTEHVLLALIREGDGIAARALDELHVDIAKVRKAVEFIIGRGDTTTSPSEITLSPRTKKVIELSVAEADRLGHTYVGTEHLLLGLLREGEGIASGVLESLGVPLESARAKVEQLMRASSTTEWHPPTGLFDRLDDRTKRVLAFAQEEAMRAGIAEIGGAHLLLGLARIVEAPAPDEPMRAVFGRLGLTGDALRREVAKVAHAREGVAADTARLSGEAGRAVERSIDLARQLNRATVLPEHVLLALTIDPGRAATILGALGVTEARVRAAIA